MSWFKLTQCKSSFSNTICWIDCPPKNYFSSFSFQRSVGYRWRCVYLSGHSTLFLWASYLFFFHFHYMLIIAFLKYFLNSSTLIPLALFLLFRIFLTIWVFKIFIWSLEFFFHLFEEHPGNVNYHIFESVSFFG